MRTIDIYRDDLMLVTIKPDEDSAMSKRVMGEDAIKVSFDSNARIEFLQGDHAIFWGKKYFISEPPTETKESTRKFRYELTFRSSAFMMSRVQYLFLGDDNSLKEPDFSLTGTSRDFMNLLIQNLKRLTDFSFTTFEIQESDFRTISFNSVDCLTALGMIAEAFDTEYLVDGEFISLAPKTKDTGFVFKVGKGQGMYEITRKKVDNTQLITRIYPFGSDKNLPEGYRNYSKRLKMSPLPRKIVSGVTISKITDAYKITLTPPNDPDAIGIRVLSRSYNPITGNYGQWGRPQSFGLDNEILYEIPNYGVLRVLFKFQTILTGNVIGDETGTIGHPKLAISLPGQSDTDDNPGLPLPVTEILYLEKNIDKYGVFESTQIFEDVYPHRTGTVTSVNAGNIFEFSDSSIDFDINDYLLPGMPAQVTFNTGQLAGYSFDIRSYDHGSKKVVILKNKDERAIELPNFDMKPAIGDKYVFTQISMPQEYIDAAENELKVRAQKLLDQYCEPQLSYKIVLDPVFLRTKNRQLDIGDLIWIIDEQLQVQKKMRIISLTRKVVEEYYYELEVSDVLTKTRLDALTSGQANLVSSVDNISKNIQNTSILNNRVVGDLVMTGNSTIKFENLAQKSGVSPIGIDTDGRIYKI